MKLMYCIDCKNVVSIDSFLRICNCGHSYCYKPGISLMVRVCGPCRVYALRDKDLQFGMGKFWRIKEPNSDVQRISQFSETFFRLRAIFP